MSDPILAPLKWIGSKALDLLAERVENRIIKQIDPEIAQIHQELKEIRSTQEEILIAPLNEGLKRMKRGELEKAADLLFEAESKNPYAPVPKMWLALALARSNKDRSLASELLSESVEINPYCVLERSAELMFSLIPATASDRRSKNKLTPSGWSLSLDDEKFTKRLASRFKWPKRIISRFAGAYSSGSTAAVVVASVCGQRLAVHWLAAGNLRRHHAEEVLALFNVDSEIPVWAHINKDEDLVMLTYRHVFTYQRKRELYALRGLATGSCEKTMSKNYFEIMFTGANSNSAAFARSNWKGTPPVEAYEKSAHFLEPRVVSTDPTLGHYPRLFSEGATLHDPCGLNTPIVTVSNNWTHDHFSGGDMVPNCWLIGNARLVCGDLSETVSGRKVRLND